MANGKLDERFTKKYVYKVRDDGRGNATVVKERNAFYIKSDDE